MNWVCRLRRALGKIPPAITVALALVIAVGIAWTVRPPTKDIYKECEARCSPRHSRIIADMDYPKGRQGYRQKCDCY